MDYSIKNKAELSDIIDSLEQLNNLLIEYNKSLNGNNEKTDLTHLIFREAHNLKSSLFVINKSFSSKLILALEALFDLFRKGKGKSSPAIIDKCLKCIELIKNNLLNSTEEAEESVSFTDELLEIHKTCLNSSGEIIDVTLTLNKHEFEHYKRAEHEGLNIFQVDKLLQADISREDFDNLFIYQDIKEIGFLICSFPSFTEINSSHHETILKIIFATKADEKELGMYIFDPLKKIRLEVVLGKAEEENETENLAKMDLRILLTESDFFSRRLLQPILGKFGTFDIAVGAEEALMAYKHELENERGYDIITLDILMSDYDGHVLINEIRELEASQAISYLNGAKIIVISAIDESSNIIASFMELANSYLFKPINREEITSELVKMFLLESNVNIRNEFSGDIAPFTEAIKNLVVEISALNQKGKLKEISRNFFIIKNIAAFINFNNLAEAAGQLCHDFFSFDNNTLFSSKNSFVSDKLFGLLSLAGESDLSVADTAEINREIRKLSTNHP